MRLDHRLTRALSATALLAGLLTSAPEVASALPLPGAKGHGFRLFARALSAFVINRVYLGLSSAGLVGVDSTGSSVLGGGFWPKGTGDQYVFSSGLQGAGIIDPSDLTNPWHGDTTGFFFFDPKGTTVHGEEIQPIYNANNPNDKAQWPDAACVPNGDGAASDPTESMFFPLLRTDPSNINNQNCRISASQGDIWWLTWDGNPSLNVGRRHPLGVLVEQRGMGWNFPTGNEDIAYFIYTFYNITSTNPADYATARPALRPILLQAANRFQQINNAKFGITLPTGGYTITNFYANFSADMDVANAAVNYSSVNVPFALGYVYDHSFGITAGWSYPNDIFGAAGFFTGTGFVGVKYLKSPKVNGVPVGLTLFSNTIRQGAFDDPQTALQLYRYVSGTLNTQAGDAPCNTGNPAVTHICYVNNTQPNDMRFFQSSGPLTLPPGQFGSVVVAYEFAAAHGPNPNCGASANCIKPGNALATNDIATMQGPGVNKVDSLTGFVKFNGDSNFNGKPDQTEFIVHPGSLLEKSLVAQAVFDGGFLLPFAPEPPPFFLIPGDNQVTVLWRPSPTEISGDPFFALASQPKVQLGANLVNNSLYDPTYRNLDVEGYRVYRGRVDSPNLLTLLAQFDYTGTVISDYTGTINAGSDCAPEFGITTSCPGLQPNLKDGVALTNHVDYDLVGDIIQTKARSLLSGNATTLTTKADTAVVGLGAHGACQPRACPALTNSGVPFVFVDHTPRNNFRYFYSVAAFDVNSLTSGPSSLESLRNTKSVVPVRPAGNYENTASLVTHVVGRGVAMDTIITQDPTIDPVKGTFSGPSRPANGLAPNFVGQFVKQVIAAPGNFSVTLDSITVGQADEFTCCGGVDPGVPTQHFVTVHSGGASTPLVLSIIQNGNDNTSAGGQALFDAVSINNSLASRYGGDSSFHLKGAAFDTLPSIFLAGGFGTGCRFGGGPIPAGTDCIYNGPRWFDSPGTPTSSPLPSAREGTETFADPTSANCFFPNGNDPTCVTTGFNNGGKLAGVDSIHIPVAYMQLIRRWRNVEAVMGTVYRAADMNVYWGAGGVIDSVIDLTHNVPIPFSPRIGTSWGVVTAANTGGAGSSDTRPTVLTANDFACVAPMGSASGGITNPSLQYPCAGDALMTNTATLGSIAFYKDAQANAATAPISGNGFGLYITGTFSMFQMAALPTAGTVWTLRTYSGAIGGGQGIGGGSTGKPYSFTQTTRPMTAVGAEVQVAFAVTNKVNAVTQTDLSAVHTVPDPYYVTDAFENGSDVKVIKFVNLPQDCFIRIYSSSGVLVNLIEHHTTTFGGSEDWNVRNRNNQVVASGVYFYHIEAAASGQRRVGRMTIVNFAQ